MKHRSLTVQLPYPPSLNRYWRTFRGRQVVSAEARDYKRHAAILARVAGLQAPIDGPVACRAVLSPKKPLRAGKGTVRCIDLDNALKVAIDALQGVAYLNDAQLVDISISRGLPILGGGLLITIDEAR